MLERDSKHIAEGKQILVKLRTEGKEKLSFADNLYKRNKKLIQLIFERVKAEKKAVKKNNLK